MVDLGKPLMWSEPPTGRGSKGEAAFQLPAGTVTFLMSDIESSTRLWQDAPEAMPGAVEATYQILDEAVSRHAGVRPLEQGEGDSVVAAFSRASDAVAAALQAQRTLHAHPWPAGISLRVRIALHTADAQLRDEGNYFGVALARCARLRSIAHGEQTLLSRATHDLVVDRLPDDVHLVDCGIHRLRDLGRPEHVYALAHPDLPSEFGPLHSLDAFPNNLPDRLTSFVGRARELEDIRGVLEDTRLLTLTGAGGAGKTRLALQIAADALEGFPDGAWWVELAALTEPRSVGEALASAVGVRPLPGMSALQAACSHLAQRRAMVVLDNCEHLLPASAETAEALLHGCPNVAVIATSRTPLGVAGETDWRVPSLSLPGPEGDGESVQALGQCDAVRLFIERARKARPNFAVTNDNAPAVGQICVDLDGIPLAIELAAARVRMLAVEQIASGLGDRFHLLTGGARAALPRHQTLRASVDWSYELLAEQERTLFRRLAIFAGGFTLDACEEIGSDDGLERVAVLDLLTSLVDKSLVAAEEHGTVVRYRLLETVRQYALERLIEAAEEDSVRDRHRDMFLSLSELVAPNLLTASQRQWLEVLDPESANLAAALDRAADTDPERALRMCVALRDWWRMRGLYAAAEFGYGRALDAGDPSPSPLRSRVLGGRAYQLTLGGGYEMAMGFGQEAIAMAEQVGDEASLARAINGLCLLQLFVDPIGSRPGFERARELARAGGDDWCFVDATLNLAWSHLMCDEHEEGDRVREEVLALAERRGDNEGVAYYWAGMSWRQLMRADGARLHEYTARALAASREVGELPVTEAIAHFLIARLDLAAGRPEAAIARLEASRERTIAAGAGVALPTIEAALAAARTATGDLSAARDGLEEVIASGADFGWGMAGAAVQLADILRVAGEPSGAETRAREALEIAERMQIPSQIASCKEVLGRLASARGEWSEAEAILHEALGPRVEHELLLYLAQTFDALAEVAAGLESHEEAARILGAAARARSDLALMRWAPDQPRFAELERTLQEILGVQAFATAHDEGAALKLDEAVTWLRRTRGERRRPSRGWGSLTPTELQVVQLVAEGLTNPQIGERMFITRGTAKVHVSNIFAKLGVTTRAELAAEAARRGIGSPARPP